MSVEIRHFTEPTCMLYNHRGEFQGYIHSFASMNDVRIQIKNQQLRGWYFIFEGQMIIIDENGRCNVHPVGFYDKTTDQLFELL